MTLLPPDLVPGCSILSWYGGPAATTPPEVWVAGEREHGWAAWLMCARDYLGLTREQMTAGLKVRFDVYKAWEAGRDPIPAGVLDDVRALLDRFDRAVEELLNDPPSDGVVRVWRGESADAPYPSGMWRRIVFSAAVDRPQITPMFPEDIPDKDD